MFDCLIVIVGLFDYSIGRIINCQLSTVNCQLTSICCIFQKCLYSTVRPQHDSNSRGCTICTAETKGSPTKGILVRSI
ncbi:MAG: hypothetical protein HC942_30000 [Microcoleus sp. SU_5_6]|nr:hypothetical protein [Microcoleus sp. SU_5_6]